ncbi:unnamed protein product [Lactuca saligna]|uniref:Uncharacterized protein n=1 Tax=Lactuca saligna TaxID=75948 RepID=A0AA36A3T7_LACSI|nr:unnamed protein product [Lactuca saligna]
MKINKEMLVIETKRHELRKKLFWLKRQQIFGDQFKIIFSFKNQLDKTQHPEVLQPGAKDVSKYNKLEERSMMKALNSLAHEGFYSDDVENSLNSVESSLPVTSTTTFPQGLTPNLRSVPNERLKARVDKEGSRVVSTQLIEKFILNNPYCPNVEAQVHTYFQFENIRMKGLRFESVQIRRKVHRKQSASQSRIKVTHEGEVEIEITVRRYRIKTGDRD